jgi:hypothetical protein
MKVQDLRTIPPSGGSHWGARCQAGGMQFFEHGPTRKHALARLKRAVELCGGIWPRNLKLRSEANDSRF